jgi:replicative DNA helicase
MVNIEKPSLPIISQDEAIKRANSKIYYHMITDDPGIKCRWDKLNKAMGGQFQLGQVTSIAGASGSGKSFVLNMLREDFANPSLNPGHIKKLKILAFSLEMSAAEEVIRTYGSKLKTSYSQLISSYTKLKKEEYTKILQTSSKLKGKSTIWYVEKSGNRNIMMNTVDKFMNKFKDCELVVTIDHSLLMQYLDEKSEIELIVNVAKLAHELKKKYNATVIVLGQLNGEIERIERITNKMLHFPKKTDLHGSKQLYHIVDNQLVIHRPEMLQISEYGLNNQSTKDLVAMHIIKSRHAGNEGVIYFRNDFDHSNLIYPYDKQFKIK